MGVKPAPSLLLENVHGGLHSLHVLLVVGATALRDSSRDGGAAGRGLRALTGQEATGLGVAWLSHCMPPGMGARRLEVARWSQGVGGLPHRQCDKDG